MLRTHGVNQHGRLLQGQCIGRYSYAMHAPGFGATCSGGRRDSGRTSHQMLSLVVYADADTSSPTEMAAVANEAIASCTAQQ